MREIRALIFDFDGTLVDFVEADEACLRLLHSMTGTGIYFDTFLDKAVETIMEFHELVRRNSVDPLTMHRYRLRRTFSELGIPWDGEYVRFYKDALVDATRPNDGALELLQNLGNRVKLGLLTNAYDPVMQRRRIAASGLEGFFDEIVISGAEDCAKPDTKIFLLLCSRLGVDPKECIFIGDSPEYDIAGAGNAGMRTVLIGDGGHGTGHGPDHRIGYLREIGPLLDGLVKPAPGNHGQSDEREVDENSEAGRLENGTPAP